MPVSYGQKNMEQDPFSYFLEGLGDSLPKFLQQKVKDQQDKKKFDAVSSAITPEMEASDPSFTALKASRDLPALTRKLQDYKKPDPMVDLTGRLAQPTGLPDLAQQPMVGGIKAEGPLPELKNDPLKGISLPGKEAATVLDAAMRNQTQESIRKQMEQGLNQRQQVSGEQKSQQIEQKGDIQKDIQTQKGEQKQEELRLKSKYGVNTAGVTDAQITGIAGQLIRHETVPSMYSKKIAGLAMLKAQELDPTYKPEQDELDYSAEKRATSTANNATFVNKIKNADSALKMLPSLKQTIKDLDFGDVKVANHAILFSEKQLSDPRAANLNMQLAFVADKIGSIMQGGGSTTSDFKVKLALAALDGSYSATTLTSVLDNVATYLQQAKDEYSTVTVVKPGQQQENKGPKKYNPATGKIE